MVLILARPQFLVVGRGEVVEDHYVVLSERGILKISKEPVPEDDKYVELVIGGRGRVAGLPLSVGPVDLPEYLYRHADRADVDASAFTTDDYFYMASLLLSHLLSKGVGFVMISTPKIDPVARALNKAGIPGVVLRRTTCEEDGEAVARELEAFAERWSNATPNVIPGVELRGCERIQREVGHALRVPVLLYRDSRELYVRGNRYTIVVPQDLASKPRLAEDCMCVGPGSWHVYDPRCLSSMLLGLEDPALAYDLMVRCRTVAGYSRMLRVGAEADLLIVSTDRPEDFRILGRRLAVVPLIADGRVETLVVAGQVLVDGGEVISEVQDHAWRGYSRFAELERRGAASGGH